MISASFIKLNIICNRQSGRLRDLQDHGKDHFEAISSCYHVSYVSTKLPSARMKPRSQKCGKVSDLVRSLLVTGEGSFVVHLHSLLIFDGELGGGRGKLSQHPQKHFSFISYSECLCFFIHFSVSSAP